jgi:hypothetical protein
VHDCVNNSLQNRAKHGVFSFMHQVKIHNKRRRGKIMSDSATRLLE